MFSIYLIWLFTVILRYRSYQRWRWRKVYIIRRFVSTLHLGPYVTRTLQMRQVCIIEDGIKMYAGYIKSRGNKSDGLRKLLWNMEQTHEQTLCHRDVFPSLLSWLRGKMEAYESPCWLCVSTVSTLNLVTKFHETRYECYLIGGHFSVYFLIFCFLNKTFEQRAELAKFNIGFWCDICDGPSQDFQRLLMQLFCLSNRNMIAVRYVSIRSRHLTGNLIRNQFISTDTCTLCVKCRFKSTITGKVTVRNFMAVSDRFCIEFVRK